MHKSTSSSSSYSRSYSSSSSSSSSSDPIDLAHDVIVAMACRSYGEGRVFVHTDRIGAFKTGHGDNPKEFWRRVLEWTSKKTSNDLIRVGLIINTQPSASDKIHSMKPISVDKLSISDLASVNLSNYDCLYVVGLSPSVASVVMQKVQTFVENGGGLAIEYPNIGDENINILRDIDDLYCYSDQRLLTSNAYWTIDGGNSYVFWSPAEISFMSTLRQSDFSSDWTILMTNIPNVVTTTTTTPIDSVISFDQHSGSEFFVSFIGAMQNGVVFVQPEDEYASSSSSSSTEKMTSSSSSSTEFMTSSSSSSESLSSLGISSASSSSSSQDACLLVSGFTGGQVVGNGQYIWNGVLRYVLVGDSSRYITWSIPAAKWIIVVPSYIFSGPTTHADPRGTYTGSQNPVVTYCT